MAIRQFGLAAVLEFVDKGASAAMGKVGRTAAALKTSFKGISDGVGTMSRGIGNIAMVSAPIGGAFGYMMKSGVKFEQSMANLKAVALDMTKTDEAALSGLARTLGAETKFTAAEAADAMTELSRAGFSVKDIMAAVPGVLNAAAAEGISLSTSAEMVASNVRAFALAGKDATMIAGTLALASARTNASMVSLQEGLKFAAPAARELGYDFKATVGALGALHDIGIKGTLSGTALRMALTKLVAPTKQARGALAQIGLTGQTVFKDEKGGMRALPDVFLNIADRLRKIPDPVKRAYIASKVFGIQAKSLGSAFNLTGEDMERFRKTQAELAAETGDSAKKMAELRLQSFAGQWEMLSSSLEGVSISLFNMVGGFTGPFMTRAAESLNKLTLALRVVSGEKLTDAASLKSLKALPPVYLQIALGIKEGFTAAKETILAVASALGGVGRWLGFAGTEGAQGIARTATKFGLLLIAIGPVSVVLFGITKLLGGMVQVAWGAGKAIVGAFGLASKAVTSLFGALASKVPWLGKLAGGAGGMLGKVGKFAETLTAQPVRVVNFNEAGGLGGLKPGFGTGPGAGGPGLGEQAAGWRATLNGLVSRIPLIGSTLASSVGSIAGSAMPLVAKLGIFGAAVGAAGAAGYALGSWLDKKLGISDKVANGLYNLFNAAEIKARELRLEAFKGTVTEANATRMAEQLAGFAGQGMKSVTVEGGQKEALTREFAAGRVGAFLQTQLAQGTINAQQMTAILTRLDATLNRIPGAAAPAGVTPVTPKKAGDAMVTSSGILGVSAGDVVLNRAALAAAITSGMGGGLAGQVGAGALGGGDPGRVSPASEPGGGGTVRIEVPLSIDGKRIALAVAEVQLDQLERSGATMKPGERTALLQRGFAFGGAY